jgi:hypothetical protein
MVLLFISQCDFQKSLTTEQDDKILIKPGQTLSIPDPNKKSLC